MKSLLGILKEVVAHAVISAPMSGELEEGWVFRASLTVSKQAGNERPCHKTNEQKQKQNPVESTQTSYVEFSQVAEQNAKIQK